MFGQQVGVCHHVGAAVVVVWHCMGVKQVDEHPRHDCKSFHHTFTATCGQVSCLRSGRNSDFLLTIRQCLAIMWGYAIM